MKKSFKNCLFAILPAILAGLFGLIEPSAKLEASQNFKTTSPDSESSFVEPVAPEFKSSSEANESNIYVNEAISSVEHESLSTASVSNPTSTQDSNSTKVQTPVQSEKSSTPTEVPQTTKATKPAQTAKPTTKPAEPPQITQTTQPVKPTQTAEPAKPEAKTKTTLSIAGKSLTLVDGAALTDDSGTSVFRHNKLLRGHNSASVFGDLKGLNLGATFTITENGTTKTYKIVERVEYAVNFARPGFLTTADGRDISMTYIKNNAYGHAYAIFTCSGTDLGGGNYDHRLVLYAD